MTSYGGVAEEAVDEQLVVVGAADAVKMAGPGELVTYEGGREAALALDPWFVPVDHSIVGIVDQVSRPGWKSP